MKSLKNNIAEKVSAIAEVDKSKFIDFIEVPPSEQMGDLALPCFVFLKLAREYSDASDPQSRRVHAWIANFKGSAAAIAASLAKEIKADDLLERIESKGPYLNFFLRHDRVISRVLPEIIDKKSDFGKTDAGAGKTIVIDYSSPNIAKPFGIGHLRSTVLGAALKRIFQWQGYQVIGVNHLGDWGTQFGKVILAYKLWGDKAELERNPIEHLYELYVRIHQEEENDPELARRTRQEFKKLEHGDAENLQIWKHFSDISKQEFDKIYDMLGIKFESVAGESFYNDKIELTEKALRDHNLLSESQDATIVDLEKFNLPPLLVKKSDETTLYATRDLAAAIYRKETYNFSRMLYVVNVAQSLYFKQLFTVLQLMGYSWANDCHHVSFGWVKLGDEMMSTRKGNMVLLEDVISKAVNLARNAIEKGSPGLPDPEKTASDVGIGAVVFTDLAYRKETDISFDWDRMLDFSGNSGPYLQYTHARICSVIRKYGRGAPERFSSELLTLPEEYAMTKMLSRFPDIIDRAADEYDPFQISSYLLELCGVFNTYYQKYKSPEDRILSSHEAKAESKVALVNCVGYVLRSGLSILGLHAPDMM